MEYVPGTNSHDPPGPEEKFELISPLSYCKVAPPLIMICFAVTALRALPPFIWAVPF
jgi:hypothetical protein